MIDYNRLISAKLNIEYDRELFVSEYDRCILPKSTFVLNSTYLIDKTKDYNQHWGMVDPEHYLKADTRNRQGQMIKGNYPSWHGASLMFLDCEDPELKEASKKGSVSVRNYALDKMGEFKFFPEFENLVITNFIKSLPLTSLIGVRCVSLQPNTFSLIHRDNNNALPINNWKPLEQKMIDNYLWKQGFVQITINVSDGNAPLYYSNALDLTNEYCTINDPIYLFNDYMYHGVSMTSARRRQIRVTGRPTEELIKFIQVDTAVNLKE